MGIKIFLTGCFFLTNGVGHWLEKEGKLLNENLMYALPGGGTEGGRDRFSLFLKKWVASKEERGLLLLRKEPESLLKGGKVICSFKF